MADVASSSPPRLGRLLYAFGIAGIAVQNVLRADFVAGLQPVPDWLPARALLAVVAGVLALAACAALVTDRRVDLGARGLAILLGISVIALHAPRVIGDPSNGSAWASAFEILALASVAAALAVPRPAVARIGFGVSLPVFGILHFLYRDYTASVIPAWIPGHMFWAITTGVLHIAAGTSLLADRMTRLTARLLTVMFGSWVILLHIPRAIAMHEAREWTSLCVAIAMCGGAWLIAAMRSE
jgi:uncharacterized membrane protein